MRKNLPSLKLSAFALSVSKHIPAFGFALITILSADTFAQGVLLKDINTAEETTINEYKELIHVGTQMYFIMNDYELWKSTGTTGSTVGLKVFKSISKLTMVGTTLYFSADEGASGVELWKSDGTSEGTVLVKDIQTGKRGSEPSWLTNINGTLYFSANDGKNGFELWKSDGTTAGTAMLKDVRAGAYLSSTPQYLTHVNGSLFFVALNGAGRELWKSNGTAAGTVMVKDINTVNKNGSSPQHLTNVNGTLFFSAIDNTTGRELWKSNGTASGTVRVKDIRVGAASPGVENLISVNNTVYFTADNGINGDELWKSNGTAAGTLLVKDMNPGSAGSNNTDSYSPHGMGNFTNLNGMLYFTASKGSNDYIYRSDGTSAGTVIVQPIATANISSLLAGIMYPDPAFTFMNGYVYYFNSVDGPDLDQPEGGAWYYLWKIPFNGTTPQQVKTFYRMFDYPDEYSGYTQEMITFNSNLYMPGRLTPGGGFEFIRSNGTPDGTVTVDDVFIATKGSNIRQLITAGDITYLLDGLNISKSLYRTDGTPAGTYLLKSNVIRITKAGNTLFFVARDASGYQLWKTQGTKATTVQIKALNGFPEELTDVNGTLYFHTGFGRLWKSDGTAAGTSQVASLSVITKIYPSEGRVFIVSDQSTAGLDLWKYEGGVMSFVKAIRSAGNTAIPSVYPYATLNNIFYFVANDGWTGNELWRSNGTDAGTYRLLDLNYNDYTIGNVEAGIEALQVFKNRLYISAVRPTYSGLFFTEGSDFLTLVTDDHVTQMTANSSELFFWFDEGDGDFYFRASDGNYANSYILTWMPGGRQHVDYAIINETLFFSGEYTPDLKRYDVGNQCGASLGTGTNGAYPLEPWGTSLVFIGSRPETGDEPYIFRNITSVFPCGAPTIVASQASMETNMQTPEILTPYPNPFTTEFTMRINSDEDEISDIEIFSHTGLSIEKFTGVKANTDYTNIGQTWRPGMYIVKVINRSGVTTQMIVKK